MDLLSYVRNTDLEFRDVIGEQQFIPIWEHVVKLEQAWNKLRDLIGIPSILRACRGAFIHGASGTGKST